MTDFRAFTVHVIEKTPMPILHPNGAHALKLAGVAEGLGRSHVLGFCGGCLWYLRYPRRDEGVERVGVAALTHLLTAHFDALVQGRACLDPDLVDGGEEYLRARLAAVR